MKKQDILFGYVMFSNNEHEKISTRYQQLAFLLYFFNHYLKGHDDFTVIPSKKECTLEDELTSLLVSRFSPPMASAPSSSSRIPMPEHERDIVANAAQWIQESQVKKHREMHPNQRSKRVRQASLLSPKFKFNAVFSSKKQAVKTICAPSGKASASLKRQRGTHGLVTNTSKKMKTIKTQLDVPPTESPQSVRDIARWEDITHPYPDCTTVNRSGQKLIQAACDVSPLPLYSKMDACLDLHKENHDTFLGLPENSVDTFLGLLPEDSDIIQIAVAESELGTCLNELLDNKNNSSSSSSSELTHNGLEFQASSGLPKSTSLDVPHPEMHPSHTTEAAQFTPASALQHQELARIDPTGKTSCDLLSWLLDEGVSQDNRSTYSLPGNFNLSRTCNR